MPLASVRTEPSFVDLTSTVAGDPPAEVVGLAPADTDFELLLEHPANTSTPAVSTTDPSPARRINGALVAHMIALQSTTSERRPLGYTVARPV
jgi:hypothetical protein